jgi:alpha-L-fucosidase
MIDLKISFAVVAGLALVVAALADEPSAPAPAGQFQPTPESLKQYQTPEWFRDAKFGIWAHWGPQAVPGQGDWYARKIYEQGGPDYKYHLAHYGPQSKVGYKDIIPLWKAEKWDPDHLMELYKAAGAHYFVAQAVHHDNFDNWNSKYHSYNAVKMGPHKDIVGLWQQAAMKQGLRFGVSEHLGASFTWFQDSHKADKTGPYAGIPYDGANPLYQELYHPPAAPDDHGWYSTNPQWHQEWFQRISDVIDQYHPDLLYSDGGLPFGEVGRTLVANFYNGSIANHGGKLEAVYNCKNVTSGEFIDGSCVEDVERGGMHGIYRNPWQTDTSTGDWFYRENDHYKDAGVVIHLLADIVSKNGNLLLNVVQYPDGSLPPEMDKFLTDMAAWMSVNNEAIFNTRPWKVYGEGPTVMGGGKFNENFHFTPDDIRFTSKGTAVYAITLGVPEGDVLIKSMAKPKEGDAGDIQDVQLLGSDEKLTWSRDESGLKIKGVSKWPSENAVVFKITAANLNPTPLPEPPITPGKKRALVLSADLAALGGDLVIEHNMGSINIGHWTNPNDVASWKVKIEKPGVYTVAANASCQSEGDEMVLEAGGGTATLQIPQTQSFEEYAPVPPVTINIQQSGELTVTLHPRDAANWKPAMVQPLTLRPK